MWLSREAQDVKVLRRAAGWRTGWRVLLPMTLDVAGIDHALRAGGGA